MAQLQFLNGSRDADTQDLPEEAGLALGSQAGSYITVTDPAIEAKHATVYSVKGQFYLRPESANAKCFVNFRPVPPEGLAVSDRDILMFGRTLAKFWRAMAPLGSGGGGGGGGGAPDPRVARERDELRAQVADMKNQLAQASSGASSAAKAQVEAAQREKKDLEAQLEQVKKQSRSELDAAKSDADRRVQDAEKARSAVEKDRDEAKKRADAAEAESAKAKPALEAKEKELEAAQKALEAFTSAEARAKRDRRPALREGSDLEKAVAALSLPDALRDRLFLAFRDEADREVLTRTEGPVVALRGLRCPSCDLDLETELGSAKRRRQKMDALKALGVPSLSIEDAKALVVRAKAR